MLELDFSGIGIAVEGLCEELSGRVRREWAAFVADASPPPLLRVTVSAAQPGAIGQEYQPKLMRTEWIAGGARFELPEGHAEVDESGRVRLRLVPGTGDREYFTLLNLLRACLAWRLPGRGGALVHAAGLALAGEAFLLVGPEGAGKSSWARLGAAAGGTVLSDDLVLVARGSEGFAALGTPFRSTLVADYRPGRWPLRAILFPERVEGGAAPGWSPTRPLLAQARLAANLPFIAEGLERDPRIAALLTRMVAEVPCADFRFGLDTSFVDLLREWPGPDR